MFFWSWDVLCQIRHLFFCCTVIRSDSWSENLGQKTVDIKQHKSQFKNSNFTITQSAKFFWHCVTHLVMFEFLNCDLCCFISTTTMSVFLNFWTVFYINICSFIAVGSNLATRFREKFGWHHSMAHSRKPHYRRKNLADISYTDQVIVNFAPKFVAMATGVARREI